MTKRSQNLISKVHLDQELEPSRFLIGYTWWFCWSGVVESLLQMIETILQFSGKCSLFTSTLMGGCQTHNNPRAGHCVLLKSTSAEQRLVFRAPVSNPLCRPAAKTQSYIVQQHRPTCTEMQDRSPPHCRPVTFVLQHLLLSHSYTRHLSCGLWGTCMDGIPVEMGGSVWTPVSIARLRVSQMRSREKSYSPGQCTGWTQRGTRSWRWRVRGRSSVAYRSGSWSGSPWRWSDLLPSVSPCKRGRWSQSLRSDWDESAPRTRRFCSEPVNPTGPHLNSSVSSCSATCGGMILRNHLRGAV